MRTLDQLVEEIHQIALGYAFPIDVPVYEQAGRAPGGPILCAGSLDAPFCVFGRDLGRDEVKHGQPLIGAGGRLVRAGLIRARLGREPRPDDRLLLDALDQALLTNTVPYKPPGNKAYATAVKEAFRPFVAELLVTLWKGNQIITLGNEAFDWFADYLPPGVATDFWKREDRYEAVLPCTVRTIVAGQAVAKSFVLLPLPHPSPLNARWYGLFPDLLARRLTLAPPAQGAGPQT